MRREPESPYQILWFSVDVILETPLVLIDERGRSQDLVRGAIMAFGVTAQSELKAGDDIRSWLSQSEQFGDLEYRLEFEIETIEDLEGEVYADEEIAAAVRRDPRDPGIWYRTGVGWYSDE